MKPEIIVAYPLRPRAMAQLEERFALHHLWQADDPDALVGRVSDNVRAIVTTGERGVSRELIGRLPKLEIVGCFGVGVDAVHPEFCQQRGVVVTNTPDVLSKDVADMGIVLMVSVMRRIVEADRYLRAGHWKNAPFELATSPSGKTLGILGMGRIGLELAKRAKTMDMEVIYHNRSKRADIDLDYAASPVELARRANVMILCCPGGDATRNLVTAEVLEALGPDGYLVNIARGSVVDESALITALRNGTIKGAGIDVFVDEPNVPEALIAMNNVVLQPHQASATRETRDAMAQLVVDNLDRYFETGETITRFI